MHSNRCGVSFTKLSIEDIKKLPDGIRKECFDKLDELKKNIHLGQSLYENSYCDLSDCYKLYFHNAEYRIIYRKIDNSINIDGVVSINDIAQVEGVGEREGFSIYNTVAARLNRIKHTGTDNNTP